MAHVLLYEPNPALSALLTNFFADDGFDVTPCASLADIRAAADEHPDATIVLDSSWADYGNADLGDTEREVLNDLSQRTTVIVTTARLWPYKLSRLSLAPSVTVVPKPYDVEELLAIVRERTRSAHFRAQELSRVRCS